MKTKRSLICLVLAAALTLSLCACSTGSVDTSEHPSLSPSPSPSALPADPGNDALQGGGAGGTNDHDNDGWPDNSPSDPDVSSDPPFDGMPGYGDPGDPIGNGFSGGSSDGNMAEDAGRAIRNAGRAVGNALGDAERSVRGAY